MSTLLQNDMVRRPDLFHFHGPISSQVLDLWLGKSHLIIPDDLKQLWRQTGGCDLFETETILSPFGQIDLGDDVDSVNRFHKLQGMEADWVIFHTGLGGFSVVEMSTSKYVRISEETYEVQQTFASLDEWYSKLIRKEYASRYRLAN